MDYKATLKQALARLDALQNEHVTALGKLSDLGLEISNLARVVVDLGPLAGTTPVFSDVVSELLSSVQQSQTLEVGITDKIRQLLQSQPAAAFQPTDIRNNLITQKFDLSKYSNAMATIHMVLKRLVEQQQVLLKTLPDGKTAYQWNPAPPVKK